MDSGKVVNGSEVTTVIRQVLEKAAAHKLEPKNLLASRIPWRQVSPLGHAAVASAGFIAGCSGTSSWREAPKLRQRTHTGAWSVLPNGDRIGK